MHLRRDAAPVTGASAAAATAVAVAVGGGQEDEDQDEDGGCNEDGVNTDKGKGKD